MTKPTRNEVLKRAAEHHMTFVSFAFVYLRNWAAAEDVVQESYIELADKWSEYKAEYSIIPWFRGMVRFRCLKHLRSRKKEQVATTEAIEELIEIKLDQFADEANSEDLRSRVESLSKCISTLTPRCQKLIYEFYVKGRMCKDIAEDEGTKETSATMRLWRTRTRLRTCIKGQMKDIEEPTVSDKEKLMDDYFTGVELEPALVKNLFESDETVDGSLTAYITEWCVIATAIQEIMQTPESQTESFQNEQLEDTNAVADGLYKLEQIDSIKKRVSKRNKIQYFTAIAACLLLGCALWYFSSNPNSNPPFAEVATGTLLINDGTIANAGSSISYGDTIKVESGETCLIQLIGENSTLDLSGPTELTIVKPINNSGKRVEVKTGDMLVTLAKQATGKTFEFATPEADIIVLGTRFRLKVNPETTHIALESGRLLLREKVKGVEKKLVSGQNATITNGEFVIQTSNDEFTASPGESIDKSNGLIAWYRFDEGAGNITDSSPLNQKTRTFNLLNSEKSWITGPTGPALYFGANLVGQHPPRFHVTSFSNLLDGNELSIVLWMNCNSPSFSKIVNCADWKNGKKGFYIMAISQKQSDKYVVRFIRDYSNVDNDPNHPEFKYNFNEWYHIAFTHSEGIVRSYVNGKLRTTQIYQPATIDFSKNLTLEIGPSKSMAELGIDDLAIYNRVLSEAEISGDFKL